MLDTSVGGFASMLAVCLTLLTVTAVLRFVARRKQRVSYGPDDWLVIPIWLGFTTLTVTGIYGMAHHWMGYQAPQSAAAVNAALPTLSKLYWIMDMIAPLSIGCVRLSALFFYRRIFCTKHGSDAFSITSGFLIGLITLWTIAYVLQAILQCGTQITAIWLAARTCAAIYPFLIGWGISSFILDVVVFVLPLPKIWMLHASVQRKLSICTVFLLALGGLGASCARMVIFIKLWKNGHAANSLDVYETNTQAFYYVILEVGLCGIAVNLPSLWHFRNGVHPDRMLRSMRSFMSLRSSHSSDSREVSLNAEKISGLEASRTDSAYSHYRGVPSRRDKLEISAMSHFTPELHISNYAG